MLKLGPYFILSFGFKSGLISINVWNDNKSSFTPTCFMLKFNGSFSWKILNSTQCKKLLHFSRAGSDLKFNRLKYFDILNRSRLLIFKWIRDFRLRSKRFLTFDKFFYLILNTFEYFIYIYIFFLINYELLYFNPNQSKTSQRN